MKLNKTTFEKIFNNVKLFTLFSAFTGILYQYISLKGNVSFFSYSEVINDSIFAIPLVGIYLGSIYVSYNYIYFLNNKLDNLKFCKFLGVISGIAFNSLIAFLLYKYVLFSINFLTLNNVTGTLLIFIFFLAIFNISSHIYVIFFDKKTVKWLYIIIGIILYLVALSTINNFTYKNICFITGEGENQKNIHINYMNDKYIFIDNGNIIKVDEVEGFLKSLECNK